MFSINPYLIALPLLTVQPIRFILMLLTKENHNPKSLKPNTSISIRIVIGYFITFCVCCGCVYANFIVAAGNTTNESI